MSVRIVGTLKPEVVARLELRRSARKRWLEFVAWAHNRPSPRWVFRGQKKKWPLRPSVGRTGYKPELEVQLLNEFKKFSVIYDTAGGCTNDWEWLALAQHHGLMTRLLDWTYNPLVAAYFACAQTERNKGKGIVYAVEQRHFGDLEDDEGPAGPFAIDFVRFLNTPAFVNRIRSQKGLFSVHPAPEKPLSSHKIERFEIDAALKPDFRRAIYGLGVDAGFLMADLDGLCDTLNWRLVNGALR